MYIELVEALSDICIKQASIIKDQAYALSMMGAEVQEDEAEALRRRLRLLIGDWGDEDDQK